jgi:hypothetical protein
LSVVYSLSLNNIIILSFIKADIFIESSEYFGFYSKSILLLNG